jgi:hypothetical protein
MVFCARLTNQAGWKAVDQAYRQPPLSTEQILHPEKYLDQPDPPRDITLAGLKPGDDWKELGQNVVGELQLGILLRNHQGRSAAAGWGGDRYALLEGPEGRLGLVWRTTWDTEDDARQFALQYARFQTSKLDGAGDEPETLDTELKRSSACAEYLVRHRGADVIVVEGFDPPTTDRLAEAALAAPTREKTLPSVVVVKR